MVFPNFDLTGQVAPRRSENVLHRVLQIFLQKQFSIPHNMLMQPRSFNNLRRAELFRNRQVSG